MVPTILIPPPLQWNMLPFIFDLRAVDILDAAVHSGHTAPPGYTVGVEELAKYLDANFFPGILKALAEKALKEIEPILEEGLPLTPENRMILADPRKYFGLEDATAVRDRIVTHFILQVGPQSTEHVKQAMITHIEFGLGEYCQTLKSAAFTLNEYDVNDFGERLHQVGDEVAERSLENVAKHQADLLIELITKFRRGGTATK